MDDAFYFSFAKRVLHYLDMDSHDVFDTEKVRLSANRNKDGTHACVIEKWDASLSKPKPSLAVLAAYTEQEMNEVTLARSKGKFAEVAVNLKKTEPKFALVYDVLKKICKEKLGMSDADWANLTKECWEEWCEKE
jgi:hypothetical protein